MARKKTAKKAETPQEIIDTVNLAAKARDAGMDYGLVYNRIRRGWSLDKALTTPARKKAKSKKKTLSEQKAVAKKIHDTLKAAEIKSTDPKPGTIVPRLGTPLISEKAEKNLGMLWLLVVVFVVAVAGIWLQEAGIIGWADRIVE